MLLFFGALTVGSRILDLYFSQATGVNFLIEFNIIGVLAWSTLLYCFTMGKTWRSIAVGLLISFLLCSYFVPWLEQINELKGFTQAQTYNPALFRPERHADWLPLLPFTTIFFLGAFVSYFVYVPTKKSIIKHRGEWERPFCFMGRHSLIIYIGHQAILIPFFLLLGLFLGK